jgi:hypothetical protein
MSFWPAQIRGRDWLDVTSFHALVEFGTDQETAHYHSLFRMPRHTVVGRGHILQTGTFSPDVLSDYRKYNALAGVSDHDYSPAAYLLMSLSLVENDLDQWSVLRHLAIYSLVAYVLSCLSRTLF